MMFLVTYQTELSFPLRIGITFATPAFGISRFPNTYVFVHLLLIERIDNHLSIIH